MNRDENEARREDSTAGADEFFRDMAGAFGPFMATLAVEQLVKPVISDVVSPWRRKAVKGATAGTTKAARKAVTKKKSSSSEPKDEDEETNGSEEE
jgi:hypothetical protein